MAGLSLNKPSDGTCIVVAFRRKDNPQDSTVVKLRGLDPQQVYSVQNGNDGKIAEKQERNSPTD